MTNIVFFHQSADLYGSDKVLLDLVSGLDKSRFCPIVLLPWNGPLVRALCEHGIETHVVQLARLSRATLSWRGVIELPFHVLQSMSSIDRVLGKRKIHIVHSNTFGVLSGAVWAKLRNKPHVWHVHEMITWPSYVSTTYAWLSSLLSDMIVCNSNATRGLLIRNRPAIFHKSLVIWNGLRRTQDVDLKSVTKLRRKLNIGENDILVGLVGRINRMKGQGLLVEAAEQLWHQGIRNIRYLFVGSPPPGQENFKTNLEYIVKSSGVSKNITVLDFCADIWTVWDACDIAVVPSTEPESFGMVALEAMAAGKPGIASAHGGGVEIVENNKTGLLIAPGKVDALREAIAALACNEQERHRLGANGQARVAEVFGLRRFISSFQSVYSHLV